MYVWMYSAENKNALWQAEEVREKARKPSKRAKQDKTTSSNSSSSSSSGTKKKDGKDPARALLKAGTHFYHEVYHIMYHITSYHIICIMAHCIIILSYHS